MCAVWRYYVIQYKIGSRHVVPGNFRATIHVGGVQLICKVNFGASRNQFEMCGTNGYNNRLVRNKSGNGHFQFACCAIDIRTIQRGESSAELPLVVKFESFEQFSFT